MLTLTSAVRTAIRCGCKRSQIDVDEWARTFCTSAETVTPEQVRAVWEAELTKIPPNSSVEDCAK